MLNQLVRIVTIVLQRLETWLILSFPLRLCRINRRSENERLTLTGQQTRKRQTAEDSKTTQDNRS